MNFKTLFTKDHAREPTITTLHCNLLHCYHTFSLLNESTSPEVYDLDGFLLGMFTDTVGGLSDVLSVVSQELKIVTSVSDSTGMFSGRYDTKTEGSSLSIGLCLQ